MKNYKNCVLVTDLDGTLLNSQKEITKENLVAIQSFTEQGGKFAVATGRSPQSAKRWLDQLPISFPCVFYNGSVVKDMNRDCVLYSSFLERNLLRPYVEELLTRFPSIVVEIFTEKGLYLVSDPVNKDPYLEAEQDKYQQVQLSQAVGEEWIKILLCDEHGILEQARKLLLEAGIDGHCSSFYSQDFFFEITPKGSSKGTALQLLRAGQKLFIAAAGDFENDIEMLENADLGIAMGNSNSNVKARSDYVTVDNDHHPMEDIIRKFKNTIYI